MSSSSLEKSVKKSLLNLNREKSLKDLFWSQLNYDRVNKELSCRNWNNAIASELVSDPLLLASGGKNNDFRVIYSRLKGDRISKQKEREVVNQLLADNPYSLFVFSNESRTQWHFLNVKYDDSPERRKLFRRIKVEAGDNQLRTAIEQLSLLDLESFNSDSPLEIQKQHDEAFDVEVVTQKFFTQYRQVFERVEGLIQGIDISEQKRLYTQKLFNRLMFIGFIQKKGWLTYNGDKDYLSALWKAYKSPQPRLSKSAKSSNFYRDRLSHLFFSGLNNSSGVNIIDINNGGFLQNLIGTVPFLNGGLFERDEEDKDSKIVVPDECIDLILHDLFQKFAFTVTESTPLDVEVAVDPEMLGKVFEELVTGRHESGSYYTPKPIVSFMCRESLKGYLNNLTPSPSPTKRGEEEKRKAIALLVDEQNPEKIDNPEAVLEAIKQVKTCDLACGSGAYLLGMLHELLDLRQRLESSILPAFDNGARGDSVYQHKLEIIQNNLYGVDIDVFAVNIARLRLWLSLAVDYEGDKPKPLPNLKYKIEVGDSLITPNPTEIKLTDVLIEKYRQVKAEYIKTHNGDRKKDLEKEITKLKKEISLITYGNDKVNKFDWSLDFAEVFANGGFDVIVANPPYVRADAQFKHLKNNEQLRQSAISEYKMERKKLKDSKIYKTLSGKWDLYIPFLERAYQILVHKGQMIFIIPDAYNAAKYTKKSHEFFLENACIERIDFCTDIPIFKAGVSNTITHFSKKKADTNHQMLRFRHYGDCPGQFKQNVDILPILNQIEANYKIFRQDHSHSNSLIKKDDCVELEKICYISVGMVINADEDKYQGTFSTQDVLSDVKISTNPKRFALGKDVDKWCLKKIRYLEWGTQRAPYHFRRPTFPELHKAEEKLVAVRTPGATPKITYDNNSLHFDASSVGFVPWHYLGNVSNRSISKASKYKYQSPQGDREERERLSQQFHPKYLLAVMNSTFIRDWLKSQRRSKRHIYPNDWKSVPIAKISKEEQLQFINLVDAILEEFQHYNFPLPQSSQNKVTTWEKEIDDRVAALYGL